MDDYSLSSLTESKNEWCARLVSLLTHHIIIGVDSIYKEALTICINEKEENKYLMTFQNLLCAIPQWNPSIIEQETKRIETNSGCKYLEDLITCVHIIQLKALTCIRVGQKSKKIDINIPSVNTFIHNVYINVARKLYTNVYLYEKDLYPLQIQKNKHEVEFLVKEAILLTIRDNIPVEKILQSYMEESEEVEVLNMQAAQQAAQQPPAGNASLNPDSTNSTSNIPVDLSVNPLLTDNKLENYAKDFKNEFSNLNSASASSVATTTTGKFSNPGSISSAGSTSLDKLKINFDDKDIVIKQDGVHSEVMAPKDLNTLQQLAAERKIKEAKEQSYNDDYDKISLGSSIDLNLDIIEL
jgi:hypothetical protein